MRRVKRSRSKRGFIQIGAAAGAMLVFVNVNAAPLSAQDSAIKTASLQQEMTVRGAVSVSANETINSLADFQYEESVSFLNEKIEQQQKEILLYGNAAEAAQLCNKFYTAADYEALGLPLVQALAGANLYVSEDTQSQVIHTFGEGESVTLLYACEGGNFYYVEYNGTFRGYVEAAALDTSILSQAQIEQASLINRSRFVAVLPQDVYLWSEPSETSELLAVGESGVALEITGVQDAWLQVSVAGSSAYVLSEQVNIERALTAEVDEEGYIKSVRAQLEAEQAEAEAAALAAAEAEVEAEAAEEAEEQPAAEEAVTEQPVAEQPVVEQPAAEEAPAAEEPVYEEAVTQEPAEEETNQDASSSGVGVAIMNSALQFLGVPYVYGGASPSGFDCSGLVYYCAQLNGVSVPRTADAQYYANGTHVSLENLAAGDLVFFSADWSSEIEHVGIYVGNGQFVHAPSTGDVVKISDLSGYYSRNYWGALRLG